MGKGGRGGMGSSLPASSPPAPRGAHSGAAPSRKRSRAAAAASSPSATGRPGDMEWRRRLLAVTARARAKLLERQKNAKHAGEKFAPRPTPLRTQTAALLRHGGTRMAFKCLAAPSAPVAQRQPTGGYSVGGFEWPRKMRRTWSDEENNAAANSPENRVRRSVEYFRGACIAG